jgi:hypothetical protein
MSEPYIEFEIDEPTKRAMAINPENICTIEEGVEMEDEGFFGLRNEYETTRDWCRIRTTDGEAHRISEPWEFVLERVDLDRNEFIKVDAYRSSREQVECTVVFILDNVATVKKGAKVKETNFLGLPVEWRKDNQKVEIGVNDGTIYTAETFYSSVMNQIPKARKTNQQYGEGRLVGLRNLLGVSEPTVTVYQDHTLAHRYTEHTARIDYKSGRESEEVTFHGLDVENGVYKLEEIANFRVVTAPTRSPHGLPRHTQRKIQVDKEVNLSIPLNSVERFKTIDKETKVEKRTVKHQWKRMSVSKAMGELEGEDNLYVRVDGEYVSGVEFHDKGYDEEDIQ